MNRRSTFTVSVAAIVVGLSTAIGWHLYRQSLPIRVSSAGVKNALVEGNPDDAMKRTEKLLVALKAVNWDYLKVPRELMQLPDQQMAENGLTRMPDVPPFCFVPLDSPTIPEVGIYTDVYVRRNVKHYRGDAGKSEPEGFYIVGYRDGRVVRVPVSEVRAVSVGGSKYSYVFPGTKAYARAKGTF